MRSHDTEPRNHANADTAPDVETFLIAPVLPFWEIESIFKCPVVGLCLTITEQRQLLKKAGMPWKKLKPFDLHELLVAAGEDENRLSRKLDRLLGRKFAKQIESMGKLSEEELMNHFQSCFAAGSYADILWAVVSRAGLSDTNKKEIYGTIHMSMFTTAERQAHSKRSLERVHKKLESQSDLIATLKQARRDFQKEDKELKQEQSRLKSMLSSAEKERDGLKTAFAALNNESRIVDLETENQRLKDELAEISDQSKRQTRELKRLRDHSTVLACDLANQKQMNKHLKNEIRETYHSYLEANNCEDNCPAFDLCQKRVLIVGGIARMESLYRQLIEGGGGVLDYHNGQMKGGIRQLESSLKRADIVLCPVNCNSHAACSLVKNLGKKHNKPVHMMSNFSLNAVTQMLGGNGGVKYARN